MKEVQPVFPSVTILTITTSASYILWHCPKLHTLRLTFESTIYKAYDARTNIAKNRAEFCKQMERLRWVLKKMATVSDAIKRLELGSDMVTMNCATVEGMLV